MEPNRLTQLINFRYVTADEGFYIQQLYLTIFTVYNRLLYDGYDCFDHVHYVAGYLGLHSISLVTFPFILSTYSMYECIAKALIDYSYFEFLLIGPPSINISSTIDIVSERGLLWIYCTAVGGIPDSHVLTLFHENKQVTATVGNSLHISVAINRFGEYTCIVESLYNVTQVSLLLQEKGIIYTIILCILHAFLIIL